MALAKRSRGGVSGWVIAAVLALAIYAANTNDPAPEQSTDTAVVLAEDLTGR